MPGRSRYYKRKLYFTTADRLLLHLLEYVGREGEFEQPDDITQFGIADGIALGRSTVSKAIRRLQREGLVRAQRAHVPSGKLRRTVYLLTDKGVQTANRKRLEVEEEVIAFRDGSGAERRLKVGQVPKLLPDYATMLDVVTHVSEGVFDATTFRPVQRGTFVELVDRVPRLRYFFGREKELSEIDSWLEAPGERVLVVTGITGIGKTTLLARKIEDWRGHRHVLFHRIMDWTTLRNVLQQLADFLNRLGRRQLAQYLEAKPTADLEDVVSILGTDLAGLPAVLVYDDYHNAEPQIRNMFYGLQAAIESVEGVKLLVAGRHVHPFYDRREVRVKGVVRELALKGLDPESGVRILQARNLPIEAEDAEGLVRLTRGHPLFLELVDSASPFHTQDIQKYLQEELLSRLTDAEAKILMVASVFREPVYADALFVDEGVDAGTVRGLVEQSLLREVSARVFELHDVLRTFFLEMMTPQERRRYHRHAAHFQLAHPNPDPLEALYHLVEAEEFTSATRLAVKERKAILKSGRTEEVLRLLERLIPMVEEVAHAAELRLLKARVLDFRGELDLAVALFGEILRLPDEPSLQPKIAEAHRYLGDILRREGKAADAEQHIDAALRLYRSLEHAEGQASALLAMGQLTESREDLARAERFYDKAIELAHGEGLRDLEAEAHFAFSRLMASRGDFPSSLERKQRALAIAEGLADVHLQARFQIALGTTLYQLKRFDEAMLSYENGIETARRIGDLRMLAYGLYNAALSYLRQDELLRAESHLKEADSIFRKLHEPEMEALVQFYTGLILEKRAKWHFARQQILGGLRRLREGGHDLEYAKSARVASHLFARNGETDAAAQMLRETIDVAKRLRVATLVQEAQESLSSLAEALVQGPSRKPTGDVSPAS